MINGIVCQDLSILDATIGQPLDPSIHAASLEEVSLTVPLSPSAPDSRVRVLYARNKLFWLPPMSVDPRVAHEVRGGMAAIEREADHSFLGRDTAKVIDSALVIMKNPSKPFGPLV